MSKAEISRLCVGVDLHKAQFTVCALNEDGEYLLEKQYPTKEEGYTDFAEEICQRCGIHFSLRARYAKYCHPCAKKHTSEVVMQKRAAQNPHVALGVGSGGNQ